MEEKKMRRLALFLVFILVTLSILIPVNVDASSGSVHIQGPVMAATQSNVTYKVYVDEYFEEYKCEMFIAGENLTGAKPLNGVTKTSSDGKFEFQITTPKVPQTLYISFRIYGYSGGKIVKILDRATTLTVVSALPIKVKIKNPNPYEINNVVLKFYVDGEYIGNTTVAKVKANSTKLVVYKWLPQNLEEGKHTLKIVIESDGIVFENGKSTYSYEFYYGKKPSYDYIYYLGLALLISLSTVFSLMLLGRKGKRGAPAPKWKK